MCGDLRQGDKKSRGRDWGESWGRPLELAVEAEHLGMRLVRQVGAGSFRTLQCQLRLGGKLVSAMALEGKSKDS